MHFDRRFGDATRLSRMRTDQARSGQGKTDLIAKLRAPKPTRQPQSATVEVVVRRPPRTSSLPENAPPVALRLASSPTEVTKRSPAISALVDCIRQSAVDQSDRIAFTWPERVRNTLSATLLAGFGLHEDVPEEIWTLAFASKSARLKYDCRNLFVDETELARRALGRIKRDVHVASSAPYYFDYLLHGMASAQKRLNRSGNPVTSPCLYELVPVFEIPEGTSHRRYPSQAGNFLTDIEKKKELLKHAPRGSALAYQLDLAPAAIFRLPGDMSEVGQVVRASPRLRDRTDVVIIDFTREIAMDAKTVMADLRKLKTAFEVAEGRPAFVVACNDPFLAQRCREILADERDRAPRAKEKDVPGDAANVSAVRLEVNVHSRPTDFTNIELPSFGPDVPAVTVTVRNDDAARFRRRWSARAREMDEMGWSEGAHAIRRGVTFVAKVAALPVGYSSLLRSIEAAEEERGLNPWLSSQFKLTGLASDLRRAADASDGYGADITTLSSEISSRIMALRNGTEISECVRQLLDQATKKSNRTVFALSGELVAEALREHAFSGCFEGIEVEKLRKKVIITTSADLSAVLLGCWSKGPQVDTLVVIQPSIKDIQRLVVAPRLPRKLLVIGDAVALEQARRHLGDVGDLLAALTGRTKAICTAIGQSTRQQAGAFDLTQAMVPLGDATFIDFSQDETGSAASGPRVLITTASGYRLRYRQRGDCIVQRDDVLSPFRKVPAGTVESGDGILIMTGRLQERLDHLLGPVGAGDDTFLRLYRQQVQDRAAALPQPTMRAKAAALLDTMRRSAFEKGHPADTLFGKHALTNVMRWLSAHVDDGTRQPRAPKDKVAFAFFTEALGMDAMIAAQFWQNSITRVRVENVLAGALETARAFKFLLKPQEFFHSNAEAKSGLVGLFEEMTRSFDEVVSLRIERED